MASCYFLLILGTKGLTLEQTHTCITNMEAFWETITRNCGTGFAS